MNLEPMHRSGAGGLPPFDATLTSHALGPLVRESVETVQVNVGKLCNQACHHCHVEAGPKRSEIMNAATAGRVVELLQADTGGIRTLDLTGGAPELNPSFATLVTAARRLGKHVIVRCNLTVLFEPGMEHLPALYRDHGVHLICSLPCYTAGNVDSQRGRGVFDRSIEALRLLNSIGYGEPGGSLLLDLVYNPLGAFLPPPQRELEARYREELGRLFDIRFHRLLTLANLPLKRFAEMLVRTGEHERYMSLLVSHFNAATVPALMCRSMVSVAWNGTLHDCDFHQMDEIALSRGGEAQTLWSIASFAELARSRIATAPHCYGCTAGAGSGCGGAIDPDAGSPAA